MQSGIYIIRNTKNGKFYLGQSQNLKKRFGKHKAMLRGDYHSNRHLQAAWNKYGADSFKFLILEYCDADKLDEREQHYLNIYVGKDNCYNIARDATAPGRNASEETRRLLSEAGKNISEETRAKLREARRRRPPHSEETRRKMSEANKGRKKTEEHRRKLSEAQKRQPPPSEETRHKWSEAAKKRVGELNPFAVLTWEQVREIRAKYAVGDVTQRELGEEYDVNRATIGHVVNNQRWKE